MLAIFLTIQNEARLLIKDSVVLFMLLFAPVAIITVAGYSLGAVYGGASSSFRLPVVNHDKGEVSDGIIDALRHQRSVSVELLDDSNEARQLVSHRDRTPLAIEIPPIALSGSPSFRCSLLRGGSCASARSC